MQLQTISFEVITGAANAIQAIRTVERLVAIKIAL
jgi:hypothetical protein